MDRSASGVMALRGVDPGRVPSWAVRSRAPLFALTSSTPRTSRPRLVVVFGAIAMGSCLILGTSRSRTIRARPDGSLHHGLPSREAIEAETRGEIMLGGCVSSGTSHGRAGLVTPRRGDDSMANWMESDGGGAAAPTVPLIMGDAFVHS